MKRNTLGMKLQMQYVYDKINESMIDSDYDDELKATWKNPFEYFKYRFKIEYGDFKGNLQDAIADYISKLAYPNIAFENYKILELRNEWGYTTDEDKWIENFFSGIANNILKWCRKLGVEL